MPSRKRAASVELSPKDKVARTSDFQQVRLNKIALQGVFQNKSEKLATQDGLERIERLFDRAIEEFKKPHSLKWSD